MRLLLALLLAAPLAAADYDIGPGQPITSINDLAWESLAPGDVVRIHYSPSPYAAHFVIAAQGTQAQPITISGVPGAGGELPVITGDGATTRLALDYWNDERGVIKIGGSSIPNVATARWIVLENLHVTSGRPAYNYIDDAGNVKAHAGNCAAIFLEQGQNITIRNCELSDSANGLFAAAGNVGGGQPTQNVLIERCYIYDNGEVGDIFVHNTYTEADGITYQFNRFGPLRAGCLGNNLKDRSAGCVIRYNWIDSGNRQLDLVETDYFMAQPNYASTFVYGNVLIEPDGAGNRQMIHYGGDGAATSAYRKGTLYLFNNTLVSTRVGRSTLIRLSTNDETCDCRNNIIYVTDAGSQLELISSVGTLNLRNCWLKPGYVVSFDAAATGTVSNLGGVVTGASPEFVNEGALDFGIVATSPCRDEGTFLPPVSLLQQYVKHQQGAPRPADAALDIGAIEFGQPPISPPSAPVLDKAFVYPDQSAAVVAWTDTSNDESGFRIERQLDSRPFEVAAITGANIHVLYDYGILPHGPWTYSYRVIAFNAAGDSPPSNTLVAPEFRGPAKSGGPEGCTADATLSPFAVGLAFLELAVITLVIRAELRRRARARD